MEANGGEFGSKDRVLVGSGCPIHDTCSGLSYAFTSSRALNTAGIDDDALYFDGICQINPISCPPRTLPLVIELTNDYYPEEVSWSLLNSKNGILAQSDPYTFDDMVKTKIYQSCVPDDECLAFVFEDSVGDGEHFGRSFILYLDGEEVINRHESSVGRERDNFGFNCPAHSPVTVAITFDDHPQETGWSIIDSAGLPVIEVFSHTYTQEYDDVTMSFELNRGELYQFIIHDDDDDGICCSFGFGSYAVFLGDTVDPDKLLVVGNGVFNSNITHYFVNSEEGIVSMEVP